MAFWNRNKNWEDEYDEHYAQDRRTGQPRGRGKFWFVPHLLVLGFIGAIFLGASGMIAGKTMVEKMVTSLASPVGIAWIILMIMVYFCLLTRQAWSAIIGFCCWLVLTIGGNQMVAQWIIGTLESPYQEIDALKIEPLDLVVVLGGGTNTALNGISQMDMGGDRVGIAARLYHAGLTRKIVCTGTQKFRSSPVDLHPREEAQDILIGLNIPKSDVMMMQGENTSQEMQNLKTWLSENGKNLVERSDSKTPRVGIITSAWHLGRAMRLAKKNGLDLKPIPANFISEYYSPSPGIVIPTAENLLTTSRACKEYLAALAGR
jgi:uncharacterized SAM-binding protein YcdF (DUF218 family)